MSYGNEARLIRSLLHSPFPLPLEKIDEDAPLCKPLRSGCGFLPPETPQETMEFLSRSWSISALQVAKALNSGQGAAVLEQQFCSNQQNIVDDLTTASTTTARMAERILAQQEDFLPSSRRKSVYTDIFIPSIQEDEPMSCRSFSAVRNPLRELSITQWLKDAKQKRKEASRAHNARLHAAISVAGVAVAVAAMAAATATSEVDNQQTKASGAVASAAALVAAQCVEEAESLGATCDQMSSVVRSAACVKTPGDIMTLTAAAATALRAAAALNARVLKDSACLTNIAPCEKLGEAITAFASGSVSEDSDNDCCSSDCLSKGCEFLKRTRKGDFHWRFIFAYLNKDFRVVVKSQGKYMAGTITKRKKRFVVDVYNDVPSWPERAMPGNTNERWHFGIKTDNGVMELECKTEADYRLWTEGISRLLSFSQNQMQR